MKDKRKQKTRKQKKQIIAFNRKNKIVPIQKVGKQHPAQSHQQLGNKLANNNKMKGNTVHLVIFLSLIYFN